MAGGFLHHGRPVVRGADGMVSAAHPLAAAAGARALADGGNAFDAIVAAAATLNVAEPFMSGLAGLGVATVYRAADKRVRVLDFHPPVPSGFDGGRLEKIALRDGPNASGTPGSLAGWHRLNQDLGALPFSRLLEPAIRYAREGVPRSAFHIDMIRLSFNREMQPEWRETYLDGDGLPPVNSVHRQPALADTLEKIAADGPDHLYRGPLGEKMIAHLRSLGGCMTMADLDAVAPLWEDPVSVTYRGHEIHVPPPPAESFQILLTLKLLEPIDFGALPPQSADQLDIVFRAIRLAAEVRIQNNRCGPDRLAHLLSDAFLDPLRQRLTDGTPITGRTEQHGAGPLDDTMMLREHTTSMSAIDRDGNAVCLTQSLGSMFGSGVVIPGTGVCMNNFMNWGDLEPDSPNRLVGGERFGMCLAPSISLVDGEAVLALGTPGSYGILQTTVQALVQHLDYGLDVQDAIDAPRGRLWDGRVVHLESRVDPATVEELKTRGHEIETVVPYYIHCGGMHGIRRDPATGALNGGADSRRDGAAVPS